MNYRIAGLLVLFILVHELIAQPRGQATPPQGSAVVAGKIVDESSGKAIEYANVALFSMRDSSLVTGGTTNIRGEYRIPSVPYGRYRLVANFIGYEKKEVNGLAVTPREEVTMVEDLQLKPVSIVLEGAEITADRAAYEFRIDKKVVSVDQNINAAGGTAADVLENTPSVEVDIEGNVSLRGSSNFTVLVNGRPSILEGSDALQAIPAAQIKEIEIITNPSAKYDPEGTAGIINVITKKQQDRGINGVMNLGIGTNDKYRADLLLNYRTTRANYYGSIDYRDDHFKGERESYRELDVNDTLNILEGTGSRNMARGNMSGKLGMDYFITNKSTLGISANIGTFSFEHGGGARYHEWSSPAGEEIYYRSETSSPRERDFYGFNLNFQHKYAPRDHQLDLFLDYANRSGGSNETTDEWLTDASFSNLGEPYHRTRAQEGQESHDMQFKADYVRPFWVGKLETGWQTSLERESESYDFQELDASGTWTDNDRFSSSMDFSQDIHAGYATFGGEWGKLGYQAGLRAEYTNRVISTDEVGGEYTVDRMDWFPTLHLSQKLARDYQLQASYTRRIERPRGWDLEPFLNYIDKDNLRQGNPDLEPEYVNSMEFSAMKKWGMTYLSVETFYRNTENLITRLLTPLEDGVILHTMTNLNEDHSLGMEAMFNYEVNEFLNFNLSGSVYRYQLNGEVNGNSVDKESTNWRSRLNANIKFGRATRLQLNTGYHGPSVTAQGTSRGMLMTSAALRQDFMKNRMTAVLNVRDIFATQKHDFTARSLGYYEHTVMQREPQVIQLTLTFRINDYKPKRNGENGENGGNGGNGEGGYEY
ncbi:MAG TPA: TonB-dependent receptor [Bacteroidales bacterium]|nr:TonB-dependent receptor [Bacteroidales bacterium]